MWHDHMWNGSWMMGLGWIPMLLFWILIISLAFYLIRSVMGKSDDSALQILKDRLASGDIDQKKFDALFKKINNSQ